MIEFALIAPLFFFLLFGVIEFGLMMFDMTTTRFAAGEGARVEAQFGALSTSCSQVAGCPEIYGPLYKDLNGGVACDPTCQVATPPPCAADCQALVAIHKTALGGDKLETVNFVEVQQLQVQGSNKAVLVSPPAPVTNSCYRYNFDGSRYSGSAGNTCSGYPAGTRDVTAGEMDYVQVNINFTYNWLTGILARTAKAPTFDSKFIVRLEPQKFAVGP